MGRYANANWTRSQWYLAKYFGEYLAGKALDEAWNATTGQPDVKELDLRLRAFEGALSQVDARLSERIGELRRRIDKRPTREEVRQIVLAVSKSVASGPQQGRSRFPGGNPGTSQGQLT